jgi:thymidylate synthase ThyX
MHRAIYADWEIRYLAIEILKILQVESPLLFGDFVIENLDDGTEIATPKYTKV